MTENIANCDTLKNTIMFRTEEHLPESYSAELLNLINISLEKQQTFTWALSGGNTPKKIFDLLLKDYSTLIPWSQVHVYWGDERCVAPDHEQSNYLLACKHLLCKVGMPRENIHRMKGEENPAAEAHRYGEVLRKNLPMSNGFPVFDLITLGVGEDGHTASIFPGQEHLLYSDHFCEATVHPESGQARITITGRVINNARQVHVLASGKSKAKIVSEVALGKCKYPICEIKPINGITWFIDRPAAALLK